jgi:tetratricopeptide (TPR) repeat protein
MKNIILILLIALSIPSFAKLSGQARIDSLEAELPKAKSDTNKVIILKDISFQYFRINPDKGIIYGNNAVEIAQKINFKRGLAASYNSLGVNYAGGKSDYDSALIMYNKSLEIYTKVDFKKGIGSALNNIALVYDFDGKLKQALEYFEKVIKLSIETGDIEVQAGANNNIGNIYNKMSDFSTALGYFHKAKNLYLKISNKSGLAICLNNIGLIHSEMDQKEKALEYYEKVLAINIEMGDKRGIANTKSNIGTILTNTNRFEESVKILNESLSYFKSVGNNEGISNVLTNLGILNKIQRKYDLSLELFKEALDLRQHHPNKIRYAKALANVGSAYFSMATDEDYDNSNNKLNQEINLNNAIEFFEQAIKIFSEEDEILVRSEFSKDLSEAYEILGNKSRALLYFKEYHKLQDSIFSKNKSNELENLFRKQELKENEIKNKEVAEKKAQRNRLQYLGIGAVVVGFGVLLLLSGRMKLKEWMARALVFLSFIFLFEFVLVIIDPWTDEYSEGIPLIKFAINMCLALIIFPMHQYFERRVSLKVVKPDTVSAEEILEEFRRRKAEEG